MTEPPRRSSHDISRCGLLEPDADLAAAVTFMDSSGLVGSSGFVLTASLQLHMEFEEHQIYPLLQSIDAELEEEAENEHTLTRDGLVKLQEFVAEPGFGAVVEMLKRGIQHHVQDEEEEAFPTLRSNLDDDRLSALSDDLMVQKRQAGVLGAELSKLSKEQLLEAARQAELEGRSSMSAEELRAALAGVADGA